MERLRDVGIGPTVQRMAILEFLERTMSHPTADEVYIEIQKAYPTIARATVYNTLDALTKAGMILRLSVNPTVARYDADLDPHAHFHCRVCNRIYDIAVGSNHPLGKGIDGHLVESVLTYAYGVCADCRKKDGSAPVASNRAKKSATNSARTTAYRAGSRSPSQQKKPQASSVPKFPDRREGE